MEETVKTWIPTDFGFYRDVEREDVYKNGNYELRRFPNEMWLLRRRLPEGKHKYAVKFYYRIAYTDYDFANWLLNKRLKKY